MGRINWNRIGILVLCIGVPSIWGSAILGKGGSARDFANMYYGTRSFVAHKDLYDTAVDLSELKVDGANLDVMFLPGQKMNWKYALDQIYLPPAYLPMIPFAMLARPTAQVVWLSTIAGLLVVAAYVMWEFASGAPIMAGCMAGFMVLNCLILFVVGNPAGVVAPFCVIAAWCFVKQRFGILGIFLLAIALVMKPHDAGFVWLYFLLAGGTARKRALQTLAVTAVLCVIALAWIVPVSPHWMQELHSNLAQLAGYGGPSNPSVSGRGMGAIISLQATVSLFRNDPRIYNPTAFLVVGGLVLIWIIAVLRKPSSHEGALLALAAISILTLLPVYHRTYDATLVMLTIPACAAVWARKGAWGWSALGVTWAAIFVIGDIPTVFLVTAARDLPLSASGLSGKLALLLLQPVPLVLLAAGCFYLWVYIRYDPAGECGMGKRDVQRALDAALAN